MQDTPSGKQPPAHYSTKLDSIEAGLPPCYRGLAAAVFTFNKASSLTVWHPVTLHIFHQLHSLLTSPCFVLLKQGELAMKLCSQHMNDNPALPQGKSSKVNGNTCRWNSS